jgi:hypothetical protein
VCGHSSVPVVAIAVCDHLRPGVAPWVSTYQRYTGIGLAFELPCVPCFDRGEANDAPATGCLFSTCFEAVLDDVASRDGMRGLPEVRERLVPVGEPFRTYEVPVTSASIVDLAHASLIGDDDERMVEGVVIYDIRNGVSQPTATPPGMLRPDIGAQLRSADIVQACAGPAGVLFGLGDQLFSATDAGLSIWSVETATRIGFIPSFNPRYQDRANGEVVALDSNSIQVWRTP